MASEAGTAAPSPAHDVGGPHSSPAANGPRVAPGERRVRAPLSPEVARSLRVGEVVRIDGTVWGLRDATLIRIFDHGDPPPVDLTGAVLLHVAPSVRRGADGRYEPVSVGTTTSMRMDRFTAGCLEQLGALAIVGKGGLSAASGAALAAAGAAYLSIVGGAASPETLQVEAIEAVYYEDLLPECLWQFRVRNFGPLFVSMDSTGASAYEAVAQQVAERRSEAERILGLRSR
jgi:L(+)-tartrate dehydratase beta subunit